MDNVQNLSSKDRLTLKIVNKNILNFDALAMFIENLPYGRNANRNDLSLVWEEQKGTCSSKHAFLKYVADLNKIPNIELILGIYKMSANNTPRIGTVLSDSNLDYMPEAHCYLNINGQYADFTSANSAFNNIENDILLETTIEPHQVSEFKMDFHKSYLQNWIKQNNIPLSLESVWKIRERCIANLSA